MFEPAIAQIEHKLGLKHTLELCLDQAYGVHISVRIMCRSGGHSLTYDV